MSFISFKDDCMGVNYEPMGFLKDGLAHHQEQAIQVFRT